MKRPALSFLLVLCFGSGAVGQTLTRESTPEPLRPWIDWTLYGHEGERCPFFQGQQDEQGQIRRECAWPARLSLDLDDRSGRFSQEWLAYAEVTVGLPGDAATWPLDVRLDGKAAGGIARGGLPAGRLPEGRHTGSGGVAWGAPPPLPPVPL